MSCFLEWAMRPQIRAVLQLSWLLDLCPLNPQIGADCKCKFLGVVSWGRLQTVIWIVEALGFGGVQ